MRGTPDKTPGVMFAVVLVLTLTIGAVVVDEVAENMPTQDELDQTEQHFEDYCHAEYGDDVDVYLANDAFVAEHNGFHCDYGGGVVHLTQVPPGVWDAYTAGEIPASEVTANLEPGPGLFPFNQIRAVLPVALVVFGVALVIAMLQRYRHRE
jgi:hypothetical protein